MLVALYVNVLRHYLGLGTKGRQDQEDGLDPKGMEAPFARHARHARPGTSTASTASTTNPLCLYKRVIISYGRISLLVCSQPMFRKLQ
jgi:hypothetical protein